MQIAYLVWDVMRMFSATVYLSLGEFKITEDDKLNPSIQGITNNNIKDLSKWWASLVCEPKSEPI